MVTMISIYDLRVCDDGKLVHILYSWTLSIALSLSKMLTKYNVSEIGFYLRPQVKPTQLGPIDRANPYGDRDTYIHSSIYIKMNVCVCVCVPA
jgi:hypothetical protein